MPHDVWTLVQDLATQFETEFPTKHRLRRLSRQLAEEPQAELEKKLQDAEYVCHSLAELLSLAQETVPRRRS